jgi:hypothetical protein
MFRHQASLKADVVFSETDKALQIMRRRPSQNEALGCGIAVVLLLHLIQLTCI